MADQGPDPSGGAALIVGAGTSIGLAIAERLAENGHPLVLVDGDPGLLSVAVDRLGQLGSEVVGIHGDPGDEAVGSEATRVATDRFRRIATYVNALRLRPNRPLVESQPEEWSQLVRTDVRSLYAVTRPVIDAMRDAERGGRVVTVSWRSWLGESEAATFAALAGAVAGFTRSLALEVGRYGITVNAVAPSYVDTAEWRQLRPGEVERGQRATAIRRLGRPEDVAAVVSFLATDEAQFITGQVISVCGGSSIGKSAY